MVPDWLLQEVRNGGQEKKPSTPLPEQIPPGTRNHTLTSLAGTMRRRGASETVIRAALLEQNRTSCSPPLDEAEVATIAASVAKYRVGASTVPDSRDAPLAAPVWPELDRTALHGLAGDFVALVEPHTEADPVALLSQFLVCFGNCIGSEPHFRVEADRHALNLFCTCVGETSKGRKGTALGHVRNVCRSVDETWDTERVQFGLSSGEGLIWAVRDPIEESKAVKEKGRFTGEYEIVITDQGVSDKRLLVIEAEFASTLRVMNREANTLSPVMRNAWDGGNLRILTKNSPARATGAHISIIGHITKNELLQHLTRTEMGNGFGNRFLWLCVKRSKCLPEGGNISRVDFGPFLQELGRVVTRGKVTPEISRDPEARALWAEVYPELSSGKPGLLGAMIARAEAQAMRLACLYAVLDIIWLDEEPPMDIYAECLLRLSNRFSVIWLRAI